MSTTSWNASSSHWCRPEIGLSHHVQMIRAPALACLAAIDFALRQSRQFVPKTARDNALPVRHDRCLKGTEK
jgi:hypothetical protein